MSADRTPVPSNREASFRYGVVLAIVLAFVLLEVLSPDAHWSRAAGVALASAALSVAIATSRERAEVRRARTLLFGGAAFLVVIAIWVGLLSDAVTFIIGTLIVAAIPVALGGGVLRLVNSDGVTVQAVAGALAIYLVIGMLFASAIGFVKAVDSGPYFTQSPVDNSDVVYYSFTVMTTTGFGDFTAAQPIGHALAVLEMLTGQIYLVTVIGILIGNFVGRRMRK
ncbi:MAG: two pore domain potassium channel family protein [Solirubrobacterales bacterium]|nr:two pore domain potassium channel family protein [Solirubrobacterales bacterium]